MARSVDASGQDIITSAFTAPTRYSWHIHFQKSTVPGAGGSTQPVKMSSATVWDAGFSWDHGTASFRQAMFHRNSAGGFTSAKLTSTLSADTWYKLGGRYDGTNIDAFLNGAIEATTASSDPGTSESPTFSSDSSSADGGIVAERACWNVALSDSEFLLLGAGMSALYIRPGNLIAYNPIFGNQSPEPDLSGNGRTGALTSTTKVGHSPVLYPARPHIIAKAPAPGGANPHNPFGHPFYGPFAGPMVA